MPDPLPCAGGVICPGLQELGQAIVKLMSTIQELEALAAKLEEEKKQIEASSKNLREEKDTASQ